MVANILAQSGMPVFNMSQPSSTTQYTTFAPNHTSDLEQQMFNEMAAKVYEMGFKGDLTITPEPQKSQIVKQIHEIFFNLLSSKNIISNPEALNNLANKFTQQYIQNEAGRANPSAHQTNFSTATFIPLSQPYSPPASVETNFNNLVSYYMNSQVNPKIEQLRRQGLNDTQIASIISQDAQQAQGGINQQQRINDYTINNHHHYPYGHGRPPYGGLYGLYGQYGQHGYGSHSAV
jgi:hypothetical protein